jgi:RNA exonuclease 4
MRQTKRRKTQSRKTQKRRLYGSGKKQYQPKPYNLTQFPPLPSKTSPINLSKSMSGLNLTPSYNMKEMTNQFMAAFYAMMKANPLPVIEKVQENAVAIDCEMVGVEPCIQVGIENGKPILHCESALAHVAIVGFDGNILLNKYVIPEKEIKDYRTKFSGITENKLEGLNKEKHSFKTVKAEVEALLDGRIIVGHGLINDFNVLKYKPNKDLVWDTAEKEEYKQTLSSGKRGPRKLQSLALNIGNIIQKTNNKGKSIGHSPVEDARASMNLYRVSLGLDKIDYTGRNMSK